MSLPSEIRDFISRYLPTTVHLDMLLLLASDEQRAWTSDDTASMSGRQRTLAAKALEELGNHSLADKSQRDGRSVYRFAPATQAQRICVRVVQEMSQHHPVTLIRAISDATAWRPASLSRPNEDEPSQ